MTSLAHHWEQQGVEKGMQIGEAKGLQIGRNEGMQIGEAKGMQLGKAEGKYEAMTLVAKKLLAQNIDLNTISVATGLSIDEIGKLKNK